MGEFVQSPHTDVSPSTAARNEDPIYLDEEKIVHNSEDDNVPLANLMKKKPARKLNFLLRKTSSQVEIPSYTKRKITGPEDLNFLEELVVETVVTERTTRSKTAAKRQKTVAATSSQPTGRKRKLWKRHHNPLVKSLLLKT